jgi:hypothetical protein
LLSAEAGEEMWMARKGHTEEQIIAALQPAEAGAKTNELCRKLGISQATF